MRNVLLAEPSFIPFIGLGFIILLLLMTAVAAVIFLIATMIRKSAKSPAPAQTPSPANPRTQIIPRKCPKCGSDLKADLPEGLCPACLLQHGIATEGGAPPGSAPFTPPSLVELAKLFPQLEILEVIGQGGMGAVYKARQPSLDRFVALKILTPRSGGDLDFSGRFSREARALARLSHPNIVGVHDFGTVGQTSRLSPSEIPGAKSETGQVPVLHYFIMEFVDGPNLRQLEQAGKLTPREALQIIPQICGALQFAHDEGIVHRDIKPENVLLDKKGRVKIADFGLAKILGQEADFRLTGARDVMGTPHYMAPEQVEKPQEVDHRADIYSLGVVFYEMLTGDLPLGKFDPPSHKVQIDVRLDDVVLRSLANNPDRRYQHVSEIKTEVENISATPVAAGAAPAAARAPSFAPGWEYKSAHTLFGLPLLHVSGGINPATGKANVSRGIFAFGQIAQGIFASGGRAYGIIAFGGIATGLFAFGGVALGAITFGGLALGLLLAIGALSIGFMSIGAPSLSLHRMRDDTLAPYVGMAHLQPGQFGALLGLAVLLTFSFVLTHLLVHFWARKRATMNPTPDRPVPPQTGRGLRCFAFAFSALVIMALVLTAFARYQSRARSNAPVTAEIHYQVFECDAALADRLIPASQRRSSETPAPAAAQPPWSSRTPGGYSPQDIAIRTPGIIESDALVAAVSQHTLETLLDSDATRSSMLVDQRKIMSSSSFPGMPEPWTYGRAEGGENGPGEGAGYLGLRRHSGRSELRIEYQLRHTFETDPLAPNTRLASRLLFQDRIPRSGALIFLIPFEREDKSKHYLAIAYQIKETQTANVNSIADYEPSNLEAPLRKQAPHKSFTYIDPLAPKTIVLVRATNNWIHATNNNGIVTLWTDSEMQPGETLLVLVKREDIGLRTNRSMIFVRQRSDTTTFSTSFNWYFGGTMGPDFGQTEAEAAAAQLRDRFTDRPTTLTPGKPKELFSVTNSSGGVMIGYIDFERALPEPSNPEAKPEAIVHLRRFTSTPTSPAIDYSAKVPPGYSLRAASTTGTGEGYTFSPAGPNEYHSSWSNLPQPMRPRRSEPGKIQPPHPPPAMRFDSPEQWEAQRKNLENQFQELQDQGPISVKLGEPELMFSITNGDGEVFQGFLELVGPKPGGPTKTAPTATTRPKAPENTPPLTPKTQSRSGTNVQAIVHVRHFDAPSFTSANIEYSATIPPGYALHATANTGTAHTLPVRGQYLTLWLAGGFSIRPPRPLGPGDRPPAAPPKMPSLEQLQAQTASLQAQLQELEDQGSIAVAFGKPKQIFSVTNGSGDIWQGFLELIRSETNAAEIQVDPTTDQPAAEINTQSLLPEEQTAIIEMQRAKYRTAPAPITNSPGNH